MPKLSKSKVAAFMSKLPTKHKEEDKDKKGAWSKIKDLFKSDLGKSIGKGLSKRKKS